MCIVVFEKRESVKTAEEMSGNNIRDNIIRVEPYNPAKFEKNRRNNNKRSFF
jgi:hypothetical protein